jgi:xylulose-5-phosphate/fructose-6-phosphate phosphoketolase
VWFDNVLLEPDMTDILSLDLLEKMDAYWRAANYLSAGQIYLQDNPLLEKPLTLADIKPRLLGHWGTTPGLNLIYVHLNRLIKSHRLNMIQIVGPGHGGPGLVANAYLEGSYTERYPAIEQNRHGLYRLFRQFSWPHGIPSHAGAHIPGSIHEGGELGYCLAHAYGAALDNPDLLVTCVIGDGEAETAPLAGSWHSNKFLNPITDGAVLPILHLNGYKIANPSLLSRIGHEQLGQLLRGYGYDPHFVCGDDPALVHRYLASTLEVVLARIQHLQRSARRDRQRNPERPLWPMIVLTTPKGWTGPAVVDGLPVEGTWRAHQVPLSDLQNPEHLRQLEQWLLSYRPHELFDSNGQLRASLSALAPTGHHRLGANPSANGGLRLEVLTLPLLQTHAVPVTGHGEQKAQATGVLGAFLRELMTLNVTQANFRLFGPDETASNRLDAVFEVTSKQWMAQIEEHDNYLSPAGRVMEVLSEHLCQGWLEGYLLTGRHGLFACYEAFIPIVDSMVNQYAKWLQACRELPWRAPIASLNYLLSSHLWRQDHNGGSHQDPGFLDHVANKKAEVARVYLPPDTNCLLVVASHCLNSRNLINVIVSGKQPEWQWLPMEAAIAHCLAGASIWPWAGNEQGAPDVVLACAGDVPTLETLAAVSLLRKQAPGLRIRVVNVVDLMALQGRHAHPHGLDDQAFEALFTIDKPVIFAFHGYPALIHRLIHRRPNAENFHVHGYQGEGTTTTPFDMTVLNELDRFRLTLDAIERTHFDPASLEQARDRYWSAMQRHSHYIGEHGRDLPEVEEWRWSAWSV